MSEADDERAAFLARVRAAAGGEEAPVVCGVDEATLRARDPNRGFADRVAVASLGNALEAHGPALAPDIDDRSGAAQAIAVANRTGARYLGHVPYATDTSPLAARWSPAALPVERFVERTRAFLEHLLAATYDERGVARPSLLMLISGHGGNVAIEPHLSGLASELGLKRCTYALALVAHPTRGAAVQHAGDHEHAIAAALGPACVDLEALAEANATLSGDDAAALRALAEYPAWGGMAGLYLFGDADFEPVRTKYPGVKQAVREVVERRRVEADAELGRVLLTHAVEELAVALFREATAVGEPLPPWATK